MASDPHFIEHMHMQKGAFTKKADSAGKSVAQFAKEKKSAPGKVGKEARLATILKGLNQ